jgi:hypothetical protein
MKTTIEMHGYEITIEEREEGLLVVSASKDGEVVEEFELEGGDDDQSGRESEEDGEDMEAFGEEESDLGDDEEMGEEEAGEEEMEEEEEEEAPAEEGTLESFSAYFSKNKKVKRVNESRKVAPKRSRR